MLRKLLLLSSVAIITVVGIQNSSLIFDYIEFGCDIVKDMIEEYMDGADEYEDVIISFEEEISEEEAALIEHKEVVILESIDEINECYYYNLLTEEEQKLYLEVYASYIIYETTVDLSVDYSDMSSDSVHTIHSYVILDNPEIFWIDEESSISYIDTDSGRVLKSLNATMNYTEEEIEQYQTQLEDVLMDVAVYISEADNSYEQALKVYEYIILNCEYDFQSAEIKLSGGDDSLETVESGTILGSLIKGSAVCAGYAKAYDYILNCLGIECFSVVGEAEDVGHEWSMINLGGSYYHVDCTWGDAIVDGMEDDYLLYDYFGLTTEMIHNVAHIESDDIDYPECTALEYNYYYYNNLCFDCYSYEDISQVFDTAINNRQETISFSFTNYENYEIALETLVAEDLGKIINEYSNIIDNKCSYMSVDELMIITVNLIYK